MIPGETLTREDFWRSITKEVFGEELLPPRIEDDPYRRFWKPKPSEDLSK